MANNYAKIYQSLYDSTLFVSGGKDATWLFIYMVVNSDKDGYIRKADAIIARNAGFESLEEYKKALKILLEPDPESNINKHNGCRVLALKDLPNEDENRGYLVVNKDHYRDKQSSTDRTRAYRRRDEIYRLISNLTNTIDNETFRERHKHFIYVSVSVSVSDLIIKYLYECHVDFDLWANYEDYRKKVIKKPFKSDAGRKRQINVLKNKSLTEQQIIVNQTIENEWIKLVDNIGEQNENSSRNQSQRNGKNNGQRIMDSCRDSI